MTYYKFVKPMRMDGNVAINVRCTCGRPISMYEAFLCNTCAKLSCATCSVRSIESYYCEHCLQMYPSHVVTTQALGPRCPKCVACPACDTVLDKVLMLTTQKYLFQCGMCHWSSDNIGLKANSARDLLTTLVKVMQQRDTPPSRALLKARRQYDKMQSEMDDASRYIHGMGVFDADRKGGGGGLRKADERTEALDILDKELDGKISGLKLSEAADNAATLAKCDLSSQALQRHIEQFTQRSVTTLEQRLGDPVCQATSLGRVSSGQKGVIQGAWPHRLRLVTKESFQCPTKGCMEGSGKTYLVKPQRPAKVTKYDRSAMACRILPRITLREVPTFKPGGVTAVNMRFANRLNQDIHVIVEVEEDEYTTAKLAKEGRIVMKLEAGTSKGSAINMLATGSDGQDVATTLNVTLRSASNPPTPLGTISKSIFEFKLDCTLGTIDVSGKAPQRTEPTVKRSSTEGVPDRSPPPPSGRRAPPG